MTQKILASLIIAVFLIPVSSLTLSTHTWAKPLPESSAHLHKKHGKKKHGEPQGKHQKKKPHKTKVEHKVKHELHILLKHKKELNLTKEQVGQIETIKLDFDRDRIRTKAEIQVANLELGALLKDQTAPLADVEIKVREAEQLKGTLRISAIKAQRQAFHVLTPEQWEQKKNLHKKMAIHKENQPHSRVQTDGLRFLAKQQEETHGPQ